MSPKVSFLIAAMAPPMAVPAWLPDVAADFVAAGLRAPGPLTPCRLVRRAAHDFRIDSEIFFLAAADSFGIAPSCR
jgi:hypothetical protein